MSSSENAPTAEPAAPAAVAHTTESTEVPEVPAPSNSEPTKNKKRPDYGRNAYKRNRDDNRETKRFKRSFENEPRPDVEGEEKEDRKPKRKVAVLMSYCGSGYKGMQLNPPHKTIEGDLFEAFVKAGAISRANSDDPKKSSLVRCARTDKGVHAAGNVISLKLIIEDPDVVKKINENLPPSIRVWDIFRTTGQFSAYQLCDSRKYEYLLPSHVFLPPHPKTYLAKAIRHFAKTENDEEALAARQADVAEWWENVTKKVYEELSGVSKEEIDAALDADSAVEITANADGTLSPRETTPEAETSADAIPGLEGPPKGFDARAAAGPAVDDARAALMKRIRAIHLREKKAYRISETRLARVREAFEKYVGTHSFHNYTVDKSAGDPSAKRHIKSFIVADPILINGTEWLACRVHGQSFMMHQIRKLVGMVMMVVRTGCPLERITDAMGKQKVAIGKAPGIGLHLEYPLFEHYNNDIAPKNDRDPIDFEKYRDQMEKFKQEWIYQPIYTEEEKMNTFHNFVQFLDTYRCPTYFYLTPAGLKGPTMPASISNDW